MKRTILKLYAWSQTFWGDLIVSLVLGLAGFAIFYAVIWGLWIMGVI